MTHKSASIWIFSLHLLLTFDLPVCGSFFFLFIFFSPPGKLCGKTSHTYFGDSGVKGSGKVVGLAAEHKGAWVIIDLGITLTAEEKRSTFCNS